MKTPQQLDEELGTRSAWRTAPFGAYGLDALTRRLKVIGVTLG